MKKIKNRKKSWEKPVVNSLNINKKTFGGTGTGAEKGKKWGPPIPS